MKKIGADYKQRYNFFSCYTDALRDFIKRLEKEENIGLENLKNAEPHEFEKSSSKKKSSSNDTHLINGKQFTLDEVKEYAQKPYSQEQLEVNNERNELSKKLFEKLKSPECKVTKAYHKNNDICRFYEQTKIFQGISHFDS